MGGFNNPVLGGLFRGIQLASTIQNMRARKQQQESLDQYRQALEGHRAQTAARQAEEDVRRSQERALEHQLKLRSLGAMPLNPSQSQQYRSGEDFSIEMAPGIATTASSSVIDMSPMGDGLYAVPGPQEKGAIDLDRRLSEIDAEEGVRAKHRAPPLPARVEDDDGNVHLLDPRTGAKIATVPGVGKKSQARLGETAADRRARINFERSIEKESKTEKISSWANRIIDEAGDVDAALEDVARQARFNPFVKDNRVAITSEIKKARLSGALDETNELLQRLLGEDLPGAGEDNATGARGGAQGNAAKEASGYLQRFRKNKQK